MAVLCLFTNTPWPWPTPAGAASARGGVSPTRRGAVYRADFSERKIMGTPLARARGRAPQQVWLPCLRGARRMRLFLPWGRRCGQEQARRGGCRKTAASSPVAGREETSSLMLELLRLIASGFGRLKKPRCCRLRQNRRNWGKRCFMEFLELYMRVPTGADVRRAGNAQVWCCSALWLLSVISLFLLTMRAADLCTFYNRWGLRIFSSGLWWVCLSWVIAMACVSFLGTALEQGIPN